MYSDDPGPALPARKGSVGPTILSLRNNSHLFIPVEMTEACVLRQEPVGPAETYFPLGL